METSPIPLRKESSFKLALSAFRLYFKLFPVSTVAVTATGLLDQLSSIGYSFIFANIIDSLVQAAQAQDTTRVVPALILLLGYNLLDRLNTAIYRYHYRILRNVGRNRLRQEIFEKLQSINIEDLESPDLQNALQRVDENVSLTIEFVQLSVSFLGNILAILSASLITLTFMPWIIPIILILAVPTIFVNKHFIKKDWEVEFDSTEERRKASSSGADLYNVKSLGEINVVGGYSFLAKKYHDFYEWYNTTKLKLRTKWLSAEFLLETVSYLGMLLGIGGSMVNFVTGQISIGALTFQIDTLSKLRNGINTLSYTLTNFQENVTRIQEFVALVTKKFISADGSIELPRLETGPEIEFRNVNFTYPRAKEPIYRGLNLHIKSGEKIAIVGHNGAGKTTLVNLIARLYHPDSGEILINGQNLNELKIADWYKNIGILFQEYNKYGHLTVTENIYMGRSMKPLDMDKVRQAAISADATDFIEEMPKKWDQVLSERFKDGKRPSTGQWQKIAIARFFYRNAPLVIFDEPTASIDAVSEFKIFNRIYDFFDKKTVIIISHRFSTVRNADRIIVLDHGKIIEEGSHSDLMAKNGLYAQAFKLQAEGYN